MLHAATIAIAGKVSLDTLSLSRNRDIPNDQFWLRLLEFYGL